MIKLHIFIKNLRELTAYWKFFLRIWCRVIWREIPYNFCVTCSDQNYLLFKVISEIFAINYVDWQLKQEFLEASWRAVYCYWSSWELKFKTSILLGNILGSSRHHLLVIMTKTLNFIALTFWSRKSDTCSKFQFSKMLLFVNKTMESLETSCFGCQWQENMKIMSNIKVKVAHFQWIESRQVPRFDRKMVIFTLCDSIGMSILMIDRRRRMTWKKFRCLIYQQKQLWKHQISCCIGSFWLS